MSSFSDQVLDLIATRHSKRAYLTQTVPRSLVETVLTAAANAPSSKNTQPWGVTVITGTTLTELSQAMCEKFDQGITESPDYLYMPEPWPPGFKERARDVGYRLFELKGIERHNREQRLAHDRENFVFFGAPLLLIFHLHRSAERGMFLDMGMFMENVMLGLLAHGVASCPQFSLTSYSQTIREQLHLGEDRLVVAGLAAGYPDPTAPVNTFIPERLPLNEFTRWYD